MVPMPRARPPRGRIVSVSPVLSIYNEDFVLTSMPQIEANNTPQDFHAADPDDDDIDQYVPLGSPGSLHPGMPAGMPPFEHFGSRGSPFSNFPPQQPANNNGPSVYQNTYRSPGGHMTISSFSYSSSGPQRAPNDQAQMMNSFGGLLSGLLSNITGAHNPSSPQPMSPGAGMGTPRDPRHPHGFDTQNDIMSQFFPPQNGTGTRSAPGSPPPMGFQNHGAFQVHGDGGIDPHPLFNMMRMMLTGHPLMMNGHGDAAYSQEEFDRIMSQLMEQSQQGGGEPPASQDEIARIPKRKVDQEWLDGQETKECTICMEEAKVDEEISELWCGHWYHPFCIKQWLDAHGACPLCRKSLKQGREEWEAKNAKSERKEHKRRRSSRQHSHSHRPHGYDPRGFTDEAGSSGSRSGGEDAAGSSSGGLRDRISRFWSGSGR